MAAIQPKLNSTITNSLYLNSGTGFIYYGIFIDSFIFIYAGHIESQYSFVIVYYYYC